MEDKATPWSALPLGKIVVAFSLSLAPAITGRYDPTLPETTVEEPTPRITERSTAGSGAPADLATNPFLVDTHAFQNPSGYALVLTQ